MVTDLLSNPASLLKEIKILANFSDQDLVRIAELGTILQFEPHSNIVIEGELTWGVYLILEGQVGILKSNKLTGDVYDIGQLRKGSFFGEMSLIDDNPRSATVRALTNVQLLCITKEAFNTFMSKSHEHKMKFYEHCIHDLVKRLRDLDDDYVVSQYQLWRTAISTKPVPTKKGAA